MARTSPVPDAFWRHFFIVGHPVASKLWGPIIGPIVSVVSFVCSIGNVPLAGVCGMGASASAG